MLSQVTEYSHLYIYTHVQGFVLKRVSKEESNRLSKAFYGLSISAPYICFSIPVFVFQKRIKLVVRG